MKKLEGFTPGPLYAAPIRGAVLGFPEALKFLVASRERGWTGAALTEQDAELYAAAPTLLEQRDKAMRALEHLTPSGSEFVGDVDACVKWIRDSREQEHKMLVKFKLERDKLVKALRELALQVVAERNEWPSNTMAAVEEAERVLALVRQAAKARKP